MSSTVGLSPEMIEILMNAPVGSPPPGVIPDYKPDMNIIVYGGWMTLGILTFITTSFVCLRMYTKIFIQRKVLSEDYMLLLGLVLFYAYQVPAMVGLYNGVAQDIWNIQLKTWLREANILNIAAIIYVASCWAVKVSILLQYLTIFVPDRQLNRSVFWATWISIALITVFSLLFICICLAACVPREKIWNPFIAGTCIDFVAMMEASGAINIVLDVVILLIPIKATWQLRMKPQRKVSVCVVFCAGILANVSSLVRSYYTFILPNSTNPSQEIFFVGLWGVLELAVGLLISSSFVFPLLIRTAARRMRTTTSSNALSASYVRSGELPSSGRRATWDRLPPVLGRVCSAEVRTSCYSSKTMQDLHDLASLPTWPEESFGGTEVNKDEWV